MYARASVFECVPIILCPTRCVIRGSEATKSPKVGMHRTTSDHVGVETTTTHIMEDAGKLSQRSTNTVVIVRLVRLVVVRRICGSFYTLPSLPSGHSTSSRLCATCFCSLCLHPVFCAAWPCSPHSALLESVEPNTFVLAKYVCSCFPVLPGNIFLLLVHTSLRQNASVLTVMP